MVSTSSASVSYLQLEFAEKAEKEGAAGAAPEKGANGYGAY